MKQDRFSFSLVSAVVILGVILAFAGNHNAQPLPQPAAVAPPADTGE